MWEVIREALRGLASLYRITAQDLDTSSTTIIVPISRKIISKVQCLHGIHKQEIEEVSKERSQDTEHNPISKSFLSCSPRRQTPLPILASERTSTNTCSIEIPEIDPRPHSPKSHPYPCTAPPHPSRSRTAALQDPWTGARRRQVHRPLLRR